MTHQRWNVGELEIVRVVEFEVGTPTEQRVPSWILERGFADAAGLPLIASTATVVTTGATTIVVDPWLVFDGDRSDIGAQTRRIGSLLDALADAGFAPADIDLVVNSHVDGVGANMRPDGDHRWVPAFASATYHFSSAELALSAGDERLDPLREAGVIVPLDPPSEVASGVTVEEATGHGPGHVVVRVCAAAKPRRFCLATSSSRRSRCPTPRSRSTRTRLPRHPSDAGLLAELAQRGALLIAPLIGGPGGGVVEPDGDTWQLAPI